MTPSVASVQRLAFFSLRIPDSELGCDVGSARDPIKRGVVRPRSVTFSSSSMHNRDEIWVAKGRRRAGDSDGPDSPGRLTKNRTLVQPPHGKPHSAAGASRKTAFCNQSLTENRTLPRAPHQTRTLRSPCPPQHGTAPLSPHSSPREWCSKRPFS